MPKEFPETRVDRQPWEKNGGIRINRPPMSYSGTRQRREAAEQARKDKDQKKNNSRQKGGQ